MKYPSKSKLFIWLVKGYSYLYPMAKRWKHHFHGGIFPKYNKELSNSHPLKTQIIPSELVLSLQQHIGLAVEPLVKKGDLVQKNQCIADTKKGLNAPIHAPTSGIISAIEERMTPHASGIPNRCIILTPDFKETTLDNALQVSGHPPSSPKALKEIIYRAGIVGMGGAGFPTFAKIPDEANKIHTLLLNGAECEPFITCDDILMQTQAEDIVQGAIIVAQALGSSKVLCGIESNKPRAIKAMKIAAKNTPVEIKVVPTVYPMGGQKQLTQELTGLETAPNSHAIDTGILLMNVATYSAIYQAVKYGNPLTERLVTVSGLGLKEPFNIKALLGTHFNILAEQAYPKTPLNYPLIMGGPMMGVKMPSNLVPVLKTTNCILANPPKPVEEVYPCIRCGECMDACPINLLPQQLYWYSRSEELNKVEELNVFDCIECGCCSFVCPSNIPLVQYYRHSKAEIRQLKLEKKATDLARNRHEARLTRLETEKTEKAARMKAKKAAVKKQALEKAKLTETGAITTPNPKKSAAARAAAARAAAKKPTPQKNTSSDSASITEDKIKPVSARDKAIAAAKKIAQEKRQLKAGSHPETLTLKNTSHLPDLDSTKKNKRKAAVQASKARVLAKKQASQFNPEYINNQDETKIHSEEVNQDVKLPEDKVIHKDHLAKKTGSKVKPNLTNDSKED